MITSVLCTIGYAPPISVIPDIMLGLGLGLGLGLALGFGLALGLGFS